MLRSTATWLLLYYLTLTVLGAFTAKAYSTTSASSSSSNMWPSSSRTLSTRIVSYNVLSSHLAQPSHYTTYPVEHLDASNRLVVVLQKLQAELDHDKERRVIFCLQEVSHDWAGALHTFFANRNYHMTTGLYGKPFNGYMGVCMAWPTKDLETLDVSIARLSDKRVDGWPRQKDDAGACFNVIKSLQKLYRKITNTWEPAEPWSDSERRSNIVLTATLRDRETRKAFCVATYHMPCAFYAPPIMTIHSDMVARYTQDIAKEQGDLPYVLAGDFNIKPGDAPYNLLLTADAASINAESCPLPKNGFEWKPSVLEPMRSAYADFLNKEPDFTNYARTGENEPFIDTLDYIFISKEWTVDEVLKLPPSDDVKGPFPNLDAGEPSDHVLIAANLSLKS